ncbi:IclR family transcriptional regulator [Burkholderia pseudomultivorans]|uniref:Bacterial transcriptional regulator family protein n=1 Tax=Burkholderia cenocepacia TaxID=95486 RepID=A0AAN0RML9_9BURK|nr:MULTISPECIES: IclR family transcriptional regulator [Burkholderia cepacia complex]AIO30444.1 bacterial transcriptional regulator family protein [Burkholderia cenocepacia]AOI90622.1 IclR family transcriptional regulator [Burkholderia pseudomultivorans]KVC25085.1 IclR family transcriptional regulator [Burkholderia pseudomultivorans]KVC34904.1 IclR family transcriptional regulator [Burkholderia pseudomultivorans]KVC38290.1 IclR family transcriptional regulator [Burkholderia pseudomultivorans]
MAGNLERALAVLELLAKNGGRMPLATIADTLNIPRSGTHRLLSMLIDEGFVRQDQEHGEYMLALKLVSLALIYLSTSGMFDISQPVLDRLAEASGELARLGVVEDDHITFVGKAQGAKSGLRYDPDMGSQPPLHCTASGQAWLATLPDERAVELVSKQGGLGAKAQNVPRAPKTIQQFLKDLNGARERGYGVAIETYEVGMTSIAAAVRNPVTNEVVGIVSLAGPTSRLPESRLKELAPLLLEAASDMSAATLGSPWFKRAGAAGVPAQAAPVPVAAAKPAARGRTAKR